MTRMVDADKFSFVISSKTALKVLCGGCGQDVTPDPDPDEGLDFCELVTQRGLLNIDHDCPGR